mgnify:CR=1 FL=1
MDTTLIIMAAGIGSRFGEGIKQLAKMGPNGEIIMDYSIYDAKEAGFNKVVFIIRKDIFEEFEEVIGSRIKKQIDVEYVFQELNDLPEGFKLPEGRTKPWGTGQAVLCCKDVVKEPFVIINADDYYGKQAFRNLYDFLEENEDECQFCMAGFVLKNTLSDNGAVTRGICQMDEQNYLQTVHETAGIVKTPGGAVAGEEVLDTESLVSMNMWGLTVDFLAMLEEGFHSFLESMNGNEQKAEFLLPIFIDELLQKGKGKVKVLPTHDQWFGVTYKEDKPSVVSAFQKLMEQGEYQTPLFGDL